MRLSLGFLLLGALAFGEEPLTVTRSTKLKGGTYYVEGRQVLRKSVKLFCQRGTRIVGKGDKAVLVVEGDLEAHGLRGREVVFHDVAIEPGETFQRLRLAFAKFTGKGGIRTRAEKHATGTMHLEDVFFEGNAHLRVSFYQGAIDIKRTSSNVLAEIHGKHPERNLKVDIFWCFRESELVSGFHGGLRITKVKDARVRWTRIGGSMGRFEDCAKLVLEACKLDSRTFSIHQSRSGRFGKTKILKCDIYTEVLLFNAPKGKKDRVTLDSCFFKGTSKSAAVLSDRTEGAGAVKVVIKKLLKRPLNLAGTDRPR